MKFGNVDLNPRMNTLTIKDVKLTEVVIYPRLNRADSYLLQSEPSIVQCSLSIKDWAIYLALKLIERANAEYSLYLDLVSLNSHYYKKTVLELGEAQKKGGVWIVPARFTCLDSSVYDATTNQVVY